MKCAYVFCMLLVVLGGNATFAADCQKAPKYAIDLKLSCTAQEIYYLWPNYLNVSQYYRCHGAGKPFVETCPLSTPYFSYVLQMCVSCSDWIPSPACDNLQLAAASKCVGIAGEETNGETTTTIADPLTTTTAAPAKTTTAAPTTTTTTTTKTTTTAQPTTTTTKTTTTTTKTTTTTARPITTTTTTTQAPANTNSVPPPPTPYQPNPDVPIPPVAAPTPPNLVDSPPTFIA